MDFRIGFVQYFWGIHCLGDIRNFTRICQDLIYSYVDLRIGFVQYCFRIRKGLDCLGFKCCLAGAVLMHSPLTTATRVRYPASACAMVMWSPSQTGRFPPGPLVSSHEDHPNANIGVNEHD